MKKIILISIIFISFIMLFACGSVQEGNSGSRTEELEGMSHVLTDEQKEQMKVGRYLKFDPICAIQAFTGIADGIDSGLISLSPNPTSSNITFILLTPITKSYGNKSDFPNLKPVSVHLQLLFNEKIIHQWNIENYWDQVETIPEGYLKESGTYLLVCNFKGSEGCTATASTSFMVIKK